MSITIQEALAALQADGPAVTEQVGRMTVDARDLQERVHGYEQSLRALQAGLAEQQQLLVGAAADMTACLADCSSQLAAEMNQTDEAVGTLQRYLGATQDELQAQMELAYSRLDGLRTQLDKLPPVLRQAITSQSEAIGKTQSAINSATDKLTATATKAIAEYDGLKSGLLSNQKLVSQQVDMLVAQVKQVKARSDTHSQNLVASSGTLVKTFEQNVQNTFKGVVNGPGQQMTAGINRLTTHAQSQIDQALKHLLEQGLKRVLRGLEKISRRNQMIIQDLRRLVPEGLSEGTRLLGWVLSNLDLIIQKLTRRAVNWFVDLVNRGLDWISQKTGINLDFLKNGVKAIGNVVIAGVDLAAGQYRLAKTLLTNPANIWSETQSMVQDATNAAYAVGRLVGV